LKKINPAILVDNNIGFWVEKLKNKKFSTLFIFHENDPTIWIRAKIQETSWYQDPRKIFLKKSNMPCWPQAHIGMPRSRDSKIKNSALCSFFMRMTQPYGSGQKFKRPLGIRIQEKYF
jgi:hypothetical protein